MNNNSGSIKTGMSEQMESSQSNIVATYDKFAINAAESESWFSSLIPTRKTLGLVGLIAFGLTLIGATTYFVATRYVRKKRDAKE